MNDSLNECLQGAAEREVTTFTTLLLLDEFLLLPATVEEFKESIKLGYIRILYKDKPIYIPDYDVIKNQHSYMLTYKGLWKLYIYQNT